jgi:casein kinase II subunit alpha
MELPRYYAKASTDKPESYYDYPSFDITWTGMDQYEVIQKLGRGKYSEVYDGVNVMNNQKCVVKILKPIKIEKIRREVKILQTLYGGPNIIKLYDCVKDDVSSISALIFERVNNINHRVLFKELTDLDVRIYIYEILKGLDYCHSMGIMHRDIKP